MTFTIEEQFGYAWDRDMVSREVFVGDRRAGAADDSVDATVDGRAVPAQVERLSTEVGDRGAKWRVWLSMDLPAQGRRVVSIHPDRPGKADTDLTIEREPGVVVVGNRHTRVRLLDRRASGDADAAGLPVKDGVLEGPLLGVRLASGEWAAPMKLALKPGVRVREARTDVEASGPVFVRTRSLVTLGDGGRYQAVVTVRSDDPMVRIEERYEKAGTVWLDLHAGLEPTRYAAKPGDANDAPARLINFDSPAPLTTFVGWDYYLGDRTAVLGLHGGPRGDLLALMSTDPDWTTDPYKQSMTVAPTPAPGSAPGGRVLTAKAPADNGRRHWALLIGKAVEFPQVARDLYRRFNQRIVVNLDKVSRWRLTWPGMESIEFPHTFFSRGDLSDIRRRLRADPVIAPFMNDLRDKNNSWSGIQGIYNPTNDPQLRERLQQYAARYQPRRGVMRDISAIGACALYFDDDRVFLDQLNDTSGIGPQTAEAYLDHFIRCYHADTGVHAPRMNNMNVSDDLLLRQLGLELLLGSEALTPVDRRRLLTKLAFMAYVMHEPQWQPPVHAVRLDGVGEVWTRDVTGDDEWPRFGRAYRGFGTPASTLFQPPGYGQGTPNQKLCAFTVRAFIAAMLANHPMKNVWLNFALNEAAPHYPWTIADSGGLLESPFYTSRDTMRYGPFRNALARAGVDDPAALQTLDRPKRAFYYLADMLTIKDPRFQGRRVYQAVGRSGPGVIDPTFMIAGDPWGIDDPQFAGLMRWAWIEQGRPNPDCMGTGGGRDLSHTLLAFSRPAEPLKDNPLRTRRWQGVGAIFRAHADTDFETNLFFRHDEHAWDLYPSNNGAVYLAAKGAPVMPRIGASWGQQTQQSWMQYPPFGNRLNFTSPENNSLGRMTEFAALGGVADYAAGVTKPNDWRRAVLMARDLDRADPVYVLVRDDAGRANTETAVHWWIPSRAIQPDGPEKPGLVNTKISDDAWAKNMGSNWKDAPRRNGPLHTFAGHFGVDMDVFIAAPTNPRLVSDAAGVTGPQPYCVNPKLHEFLELLRIEQPAAAAASTSPATPPNRAQTFVTLLAPRFTDADAPKYAAIAGGAGVLIEHARGRDVLFLAADEPCPPVSYRDEQVEFTGRVGVARLPAHGGAPGTPTDGLRLAVSAGRITARGVTLRSPQPAALHLIGDQARITCAWDPREVELRFADGRKVNLTIERTP